MDIVGAIKAFFGAVGSVFGWAVDRQKLNNTPAMQERKISQQEANEDAKEHDAIKEARIDDVRRYLS